MRFVIAFCLLGLSACATFERDPRSGYAYRDESSYHAEDFYRDRGGGEEAAAREELGISPSRPLNEAETAKLENRLKLRRLEGRLQSKRDRLQYYNVKNFMRDDRERIQFLQLSDYETKQRWLQNRGLFRDNEVYPETISKAIESNDIVLGMSEKAVRESWGDPDLVETAGNSMYGYQRWNYRRMVAGSEGYQKESRIIYFEGGKVVGWETPN